MSVVYTAASLDSTMSETPRAVSDSELHELAEQGRRALLEAEWRIVTAESCTAAWIAQALAKEPAMILGMSDGKTSSRWWPPHTQ